MPPKKAAAKPKTTKSRAKPKKSIPQPAAPSSRHPSNETLPNSTHSQTTSEPSSLTAPSPQAQPSSNPPASNTLPQPLAQPQQVTPQPQNPTPAQTKELAFRAAVLRARGDGTAPWDPTQLTTSQHMEYARRIMCVHRSQIPHVPYGFASVEEVWDDAVRERERRGDDEGNRSWDDGADGVGAREGVWMREFGAEWEAAGRGLLDG